MAVIKHHKHVAALPATLEANSVYYVRTGAGFDIYVTNDSGLVVAYPLNTQSDLRWHVIPLGVPFDIWTHLPGVELPPTDNPNYRYIKLTASDSYNAGVLKSESVSGSAPLVQATAVIDYPDSPFDGETVHLINTERRVRRAGSSGVVEADTFQGHTFADSETGNILRRNAELATGNGNGVRTVGAMTGTIVPASDGVNGAPRISNETKAKGIGVDVFMRIY
jgi:hypothetical protein